MRRRRTWVLLLVAGVSACGAGCMEESPELMMGQEGQPPPPPGQGQNQGVPPEAGPQGQAGEKPQAGSPEGAAQAGSEETKGGPGEVGTAVAPASDQPSGSADTATGEVGSAPEGPGQEAGIADKAPQTAGTSEAKAPVGSGPPPPEAGSIGKGDSEPGLLAKLFSSQGTSSSQPAGATLVQPAEAGAPGLPRVLETVKDKPVYALSDLEASQDTVHLRGTITCSVCKGKVLLNLVSDKGLLVSVPNLSPGSFDIRAPRGVGEVTVTAIADDDGDGFPTKGEPLGGYMKNPVDIGDTDIEGITIEIGKSAPPPAVEPQ